MANNPKAKQHLSVPPNNKDIEQAVIGVLLMESYVLEEIMDIIKTPQVFYDRKHQLIFTAILSLFRSNKNIDLLTVCNELTRTGTLEDAGGRYEVTTITMGVNTSAHIKTHALILVQLYIAREAITACGKTIAALYEQSEDVFEVIEKHSKQITLIESDNVVNANTSQHVGDLYMDMLMDINEQKEEHREITGLDTGLIELNQMTNGLVIGDVNIIGARPSQGKTALLLNICINSVQSQASPAGEALIFSLETNVMPLMKRMAAAKLGIGLEKIIKGTTTHQEQQALERAINEFRQLPIYINDTIKKLNEIVSETKRRFKAYCKTPAAKEGKCMLVCIDYLQLIVHKVQGANREGIVSDISRTLKILSQELELPNGKPGICLIPLCQLNRGSGTESKKPELRDLRESGALEQDANIIMLIYHEKLSTGVKTWIIVAKNKDGKCGDVELQFNGDIQRWINYGDTYQPPPSQVTHQYQEQGQYNKWEEDDGF